MSHITHDLTADFPNEAAKISRLKLEDAHFSRLADDYAAINHAVNRAETRLDVLSSEHEAELRRTRAALKDEIHRYLTKPA